MLKKLLSLLLSVIMVMTIFATGVVAETIGDLTLKSFDATTSKLMIDLAGVSGSIDESSLEGKIELYKRNEDGTESAVEFSVAGSETRYNSVVTDTQDAEGNKGYTAEPSDSVVSEGNTIVITPTNGFAVETLYKAVLKAGIADTAGNTVANDIKTGYFAVNLIFSDDFNIELDENNNLVDPYYLYVNGSGVTTDYIQTRNWNMNSGAREVICRPGYSRGTLTEVINGGNYNTKLAFYQEIGWAVANANISTTAYTVEYDYAFPIAGYGAITTNGVTSHRVLLRGYESGDGTKNTTTGFSIAANKAHHYNKSTNTATVFFTDYGDYVYSIGGYQFNSDTISE